jgi:hypothetical protein
LKLRVAQAKAATADSSRKLYNDVAASAAAASYLFTPNTPLTSHIITIRVTRMNGMNISGVALFFLNA